MLSEVLATTENLLLGGYEADNLYHRIARSWAGAIGLSDWQVSGLVHISKDYESKKVAEFFIGRSDTNFTTQQDELFYAASYLCKAQTKSFTQQVHCFGSSQTRDLVTQQYPRSTDTTPQSSRW
ncbi:YagK/YfjJ domain-containing protein [Vibrio alginolyticus]|uniref:YagK/YfjJ domain-containing protein n=1 Tax=Vibrio alginolyticus TaxID=663 RepID=UPI003D7C9E58